MNEYDFLNLSSFEFENITRDLLQKKLGIFIESFTTGRDGGVDLRIAKSKSSNIIIQAKRYQKYSDLKFILKKEADNLAKCKNKPTRYILSTSVGLTPSNKTEISSILAPYIKCPEDILGKNDLNNLLGLYDEIETKYHKLWLSSVSVLKRVLHSKVYNQSKFELQEIKELLKIYVQNESYNKALDILKEHHYVIISGIPGIGKTTLARMLVFNLLSKEFDEFIYLSDDIDDAYTIFDDNKKQVFFFDDFLGKNFLEIKPRRNEDNKLVKFIETIKKSKNKIFILTTREYILNQAKTTFEQLNNPSINLAKCTLDLSSYTKFIRAEILYNHLFFADVPRDHLINLIEKRKFIEIIEHKNYNPRIIETFVNQQFWDNCEADKFSEHLMDFFNNPESVWLHAFENTISNEAQVTLLILSTLGTPVLMEDLKDAINSFFIENSDNYLMKIDSMLFLKVIKALENTFIVTKMDSQGKVAIEFQNPSIQDFLINYINGKKSLIIELINSFIYKDQFFRIFTLKKIDKKEVKFFKIQLIKDLIDIYCAKLINNFYLLKNSSISVLHSEKSNEFRWYKSDSFLYSFLDRIKEEFSKLDREDISSFVFKAFQRNIEPKVENYSERSAYIRLFDKIDKFELKIDASKIIDSFGNQVDSVEALSQFQELGESFPSEFELFTNQDIFKEKINEIVESEIEYTDIYEYDNLATDLRSIQSNFGVHLETVIGDLNDQYSGHMDDASAQAEAEMDDYKIEEREYRDRIEMEENMITSLFSSLLE